MKRTSLIILFILISLPCSAQWRYILGNQQTAGSFLWLGVHNSSLFAMGDEQNLLRYTVSNGWQDHSDTGINFSFGGVTSCASLGPDFFVGLEGGSYKTTNNGSRWKPMMFGSNVCADDRYLFVYGGFLSHGTGIYRSGDSGESWDSVVKLTNSSGGGLFASIGNCIIAYVDNKTFRTTDHGVSWTPIAPLPSGLSLSNYTVIGSQIFAGGTGLFRSTDSGSSWSPVGTALFSKYQLHALASYKTNLFAGTDSGVYLSFDFGEHWRNVSEGMTAHPGENPKATLLAVLDTLLIADVDAGHGDPFDYSYTAARAISEMTDTTKSAVREPTQFVGDTLMVYPNPLTDRVTVSVGGNTTLEQVSVLNMLGVALQDVVGNHQSELSLDLSKLPSGSYFLRVQTADRTLLRKIVKD